MELNIRGVGWLGWGGGEGGKINLKLVIYFVMYKMIELNIRGVWWLGGRVVEWQTKPWLSDRCSHTQNTSPTY